MGIYTDNLFKKNRIKSSKPYTFFPEDEDTPIVTEKLVSVALCRDGILHKGFKSHADLRESLGDTNPHVSNPEDVEGFYTSYDRFVRRDEAKLIAVQAGQIPAALSLMEREFLSSDIW